REKFNLEVPEIEDFVRHYNIPIAPGGLIPGQGPWKVLKPDEMADQYPLDYSTVKTYFRMLKEFQDDDDLTHIIFLNQAYGTPFYGLLDTGSHANIIHPSCLAMMYATAPWAVRVIEHQPCSTMGISTAI